MNYYIDTEFLEGTQKEKFPISIFRKNTPPTIDLISIGIVAEDGREYYAISKDFNLEEAWSRFDWKRKEVHDGIAGAYKYYWIRENVLKPIFMELYSKSVQDQTFVKKHYMYAGSGFSFGHFKALINHYGNSNKQIAEEVKSFCLPNRADCEYLCDLPTFYAYYADYDWVAFCWLFGKMMGLPSGFPMYCKDLKQVLDEKPLEYKVVTAFKDDKYIGGCDPYFDKWEEHVEYPKQENEHNAIADARWNKKLHEFIKSL